MPTLLDYILPWRWFSPRGAVVPPVAEPAPIPRPPMPPGTAVVRRPRTPSFRQQLAASARGAVDRFDSIINYISGQGGPYDKGAAGEVDIARQPLDRASLTSLYRFNGFAARYIDLVPDEATRKGWRCEDRSPDADPGADPMKDETERLEVVAKFSAALKMARLYGGALILMITDERPDPKLGPLRNPSDQLSRPLDPARLIAVRNLIVLDRYEATPATWESDVRSPRFGLPRTWHVSPNTNAISMGLNGVAVHHTRMLYFPGRRVPSSIRVQNGGFDDSVLEGAWDQIRNKTSIDQACATFAQQLNYGVITTDASGVKVGDQADYFAMRMRLIAEGRSALNLIVLSKDEKFESQSAPVTGIDQLNANAKESLAAVTGTPQTVIFGEAPGGLNTDGESHRNLLANLVAAYQQGYIRGPLVYLYVLCYAASEGPTAGVEPAKWTLVFEPLDELTEAETAAIRKTIAETDAIYVANGIVTAEHVAASRFSGAGYREEMLPVPTAESTGALGDPIAEAQAIMARARAVLAGEAEAMATDEADPGAASTARLAAQMTEHDVDRCQHGKNGRCLACGIERERGLVLDEAGKPMRGPDGAHLWSVEWRPIGKAAAVVV